MPNHFLSRLIRQELTALQTGTFYFEKPPAFRFIAGQFIEIALPIADVSDSDRIHTFSISSAPYEDHIAITTRLRDSPFKRAMRLLTPDEVVEIEGPYGKFVVSQDTPRPIAFLIGGVGITPAFSIIKQAARDSELAAVYLFYSNRNQAEAPFLAQLAQLHAEHSDFHLVAAMTAEPSWNGEKERVSIEMIRRYSTVQRVILHFRATQHGDGDAGNVGTKRRSARASLVREFFRLLRARVRWLNCSRP